MKTLSDPKLIDRLNAELSREVGQGHQLFGQSFSAIAQDQDDILFQNAQDPNRYVLVHLTWVRAFPDTPPWPLVASPEETNLVLHKLGIAKVD